MKPSLYQRLVVRYGGLELSHVTFGLVFSIVMVAGFLQLGQYDYATQSYDVVGNLVGAAMMLSGLFLGLLHISNGDRLVLESLKAEFGSEVPIPSWFQRRVLDFNASFGSSLSGGNTMGLLFFMPMGFGFLMVLAGDFASKILGGFGIAWGIIGLSLVLGNEHRVYVEEKEGKNRFDLYTQRALSLRQGQVQSQVEFAQHRSVDANQTSDKSGERVDFLTDEEATSRMAYLERMGGKFNDTR